MPNIPGIENIDWVGIIGKTVYWVGWGLLGLILAGLIFGIFWYFSFPYKLKIWPLYGSGKDGTFAFDKPKWNRARKNKGETAWVLMKPFLRGKEVEPFDSEFIYPGKNCYAFDLNGTLIPGRININVDEDKIRGEVNPVPYYIRNWQSLQYKKNAAEFAERTWWDENKALVYAMVTAFIILSACVATIWLTYKFAAPRADSMNNLADALKGFGKIT